MAPDNRIGVVRVTGRIWCRGVYEPKDPGASTEGAKEGRYGLDFGTAFTKAHHLRQLRQARRQLDQGCAAPKYSSVKEDKMAGGANSKNDKQYEALKESRFEEVGSEDR